MKTARHQCGWFSDSGSAAIETVFWLTAVQLPLLVFSLGLVAAQLQLARAETVLREAARATITQLETDSLSLSQSHIQTVFASYLKELGFQAGLKLDQSHWSANCIPLQNCEFLSFTFKAGVEPWQPRLSLLFSGPEANL